jgi:hypothetical protein
LKAIAQFFRKFEELKIADRFDPNTCRKSNLKNTYTLIPRLQKESIVQSGVAKVVLFK